MGFSWDTFSRLHLCRHEAKRKLYWVPTLWPDACWPFPMWLLPGINYTVLATQTGLNTAGMYVFRDWDVWKNYLGMLINNVTKYPDSLIIFAILGKGSILRLVLLVVRRSFLIKHWWGVGRLMPQQTLLPSSLAKSGFSSSENHSPLEGMVLSWCCKKGDPFWGLRVGSCLTLKNELSKETHVLTKQETLLGWGTWVESSRVREPRRTSLPHGPWVLW